LRVLRLLHLYQQPTHAGNFNQRDSTGVGNVFVQRGSLCGSD
jgi:hypothetical protein